ncbi:retroviral-like aspartic protease family protein [Massilia sp. SM-13]|uniref:retroviral-like aspartic protease family protein n=1 Tax=Pseudoduganella rhizocola TaxID=3382643 RepID=UPI0038B6985B
MKLFRSIMLAAALGLPTLALAQNSCKFTELLNLPVSKMKNRVSLEVAGEINGKPVSMGLSTGTFRTFVMRPEMEKQGVPLEETRDSVRNTKGRQLVYEALLRDVSIGPLRSENQRFPVVQPASHTAFAAVLGADFLLQTDVELFLSKGQVKFFRAADCADRGLSYWDPDAIVVPLLRKDRDARPLIDVTINGVKGRALLDTGAARSTVLLHFARLAGFDPHKAKETAKYFDAFQPEDVKLWKGDFVEFAIDSEVIRQPELVVSSRMRDRDSAYDMILGLDFLMAHRILISVSQEKVYLSYVGGDVFSSANKW